jgi:hypothetical protein
MFATERERKISERVQVWISGAVSHAVRTWNERFTDVWGQLKAANYEISAVLISFCFASDDFSEREREILVCAAAMLTTSRTCYLFTHCRNILELYS